MQSCSSALCILILLISTFTAGSESTVAPVKVNLHESATLPCYERCSDLVRWSVLSKPGDVLAECDQTSCRSVKEGYQMIYDQYLKGNLSLTITDADFSKRNRYTCDCDGKDICDVHLQITPLNTTVQIKSGEHLVLGLDVSEEMEVLYSSTHSSRSSSGQMCTVILRSLQCKPEYERRVLAALHLRNVTPSDSGVYTVMDARNEEVIHTYTVTVGSAGGGELKGADEGAAVPVWTTVLLGVLVAVIVGLAVEIVRLREEFSSSRRRNEE
ncbi:hypothetical protein MHYP_G00263330 [Metynnis hypsauchen]